MKTYNIHARLPMTIEARNAGATGRNHWWVFAARVKATTARAACAIVRKGEFAHVDKLRAEEVR